MKDFRFFAVYTYNAGARAVQGFAGHIIYGSTILTIKGMGTVGGQSGLPAGAFGQVMRHLDANVAKGMRAGARKNTNGTDARVALPDGAGPGFAGLHEQGNFGDAEIRQPGSFLPRFQEDLFEITASGSPAIIPPVGISPEMALMSNDLTLLSNRFPLTDGVEPLTIGDISS
jgi:hypothetical protein